MGIIIRHARRGGESKGRAGRIGKVGGGGSSHEIRCAKIAGLGELHTGRRKIQPAGRVIREFYEAAHQSLKHDFFDAVGGRRRDGRTCFR
jgi:hypothetical protein